MIRDSPSSEILAISLHALYEYALLNYNCAVGIYTASTDSTADAFAVEVSRNGTDWLLRSAYTAITTIQFNAFAVEGWRHLRVAYSNSSGVDQTVEIDWLLELEIGFWLLLKGCD